MNNINILVLMFFLLLTSSLSAGTMGSPYNTAKSAGDFQFGTQPKVL